MVVVRAAVMALVVAWAATSTIVEARPLAVRVQWGGGTPQAWSGTLEAAGGGTRARQPVSWRTLSTDIDAATHVHDADGMLHVHQPRPIASDGVELVVDDWRTARLVVTLAAAEGGTPTRLDVPLVDLLTEPAQRPLDSLGNRLAARVAVVSALHVELASADAAAATTADALGLVRRPGDRLRVRVDPLLVTRLQGGHTAELRIRLTSPQGAEVATQAVGLVPLVDAAAGAGPAVTEFEPVSFDVSLPTEEGVSVLGIEAVERGGLRWARPLASRSIEIAAVDDRPIAASGGDPWKSVYEFDPGSPRLLERLRRLPGVSLPAMPLPEMPMPSLSAASMQLPKMPSMPLPAVPLPSVSAMVPRISGLLTHGHSTVTPHPLGAMLRLPPCETPGVAGWEAISLAGLQPGSPHAVEIDYPTDQDATVAVAVLEADAAGVIVQARHAGGFEVAQPRIAPPPPTVAAHRFVFWPTTRQPLLLIANASPRSPALIGRVRVRAGPARLPVESPRPPAAVVVRTGAAARRVHAFVDSPDLARRFGGVVRFAAEDGRVESDWAGQVAAAGHLAELVAARGGAGTLLTAYAEGAALWPSRATRQAPRWDAASGGTGRDVLTAVARGHARHGLALIPAARFDAPLPAVEAALAEGAAGTGVACIGRDGKPRRLMDGSLHYNVLHPLVQRAVEDVLVEMAGAVRGSAAVAGVAVVMPRDGWLHLPGVAWPLDDDTFGRFADTLPSPPAPVGEGRFAERARLVEGPFREQWIAWRCGEMARFHARLAAAVAAVDDRWPLHVVPTTLFVDTDAAGPAADGTSDDDRVRVAGLDPAAVRPVPAAERVVYCWPRVQPPADGVRERAIVNAANRSPAVGRAAAAAARRAAVLIGASLPVDLADVVPHGPFGTATAREPALVGMTEPTSRGFVEAVGLADVEQIFDATLLADEAGGVAARTAFASLPALPADELHAAQSLVVRTCRHGGLSWMLVANRAAAPVTARLGFAGRPTTAVDAVDGTPVAATAAGELLVPLPAWGLRCVLVEGDCGVAAVRAEYGDDVRRAVADRLDRLRRRRGVLDAPVPLQVLDNPAFELGAAPTEGRSATMVAGWEVVESRRGGVTQVAGAGAAGQPGRGLEFTSFTGLSTLRSNPFTPPATGRVSIAAWLRVKDSSAQPPLRIAIEGVQGDREYYRFAAIGGLTGGRPLTREWSQFVLQVDDLPAGGVESLRVRFDLLGPGAVQIDDVRVFDLAFDDGQRTRVTTAIDTLEHQFTSGDLGGCLVGLEGYWPAFLDTFVSDAVVAAVEASSDEPAPPASRPPERQAGGMMDRLRSWWQ